MDIQNAIAELPYVFVIMDENIRCPIAVFTSEKVARDYIFKHRKEHLFYYSFLLDNVPSCVSCTRQL